MNSDDLKKRLPLFAVRTIKMAEKLPNTAQEMLSGIKSFVQVLRLALIIGLLV